MTLETSPQVAQPSIKNRLVRFGAAILNRLSANDSADYLSWRHQFMLERLWLATRIAILCILTLTAASFYYFNSNQFEQDALRFFKDPTLVDRLRTLNTTQFILKAILLLGCVVWQRTKWGRQHPAVMFLSLSLSLTMSDHIAGTWLKIPTRPDWALEFLGQALLIPVCWRLHLISQLVPIAYYAIAYPLLGITHLGERSIYNEATLATTTSLFWVCLICDLSVYLYERLKRSEFESQRQLRVLLHSVSHDLRTPVMGTSIVLQNLLRKLDQKIIVDRLVLERLLQGSDRQLTLINSLLEAQNMEVQGVTLRRETLYLCHLVDAVLTDLTPVLQQHQVIVDNHVSSSLPTINGDAGQLWRVYSNLITNALKHNPNGIKLTLDAELLTLPNDTKKQLVHRTEPLLRRKNSVASGTFRSPISHSSPSMSPYLRCTVQDNGVGIDRQQTRHLFDLYTRGTRARYMPGLGLGLYLCKEIITAHGGEIGVISTLGQGTIFWFTVPCIPSGRG